MSSKVIVHKSRTNTLKVNLNMDVSTDTLTSEIRATSEVDGLLLATWTVAWDSAYAGDGTDGRLVLTLDDTITAQIVAASGFMDIKRVTGGEPVPLFDKPLDVEFRGVVTA